MCCKDQGSSPCTSTNKNKYKMVKFEHNKETLLEVIGTTPEKLREKAIAMLNRASELSQKSEENAIKDSYLIQACYEMYSKEELALMHVLDYKRNLSNNKQILDNHD